MTRLVCAVCLAAAVAGCAGHDTEVTTIRTLDAETTPLPIIPETTTTTTTTPEPTTTTTIPPPEPEPETETTTTTAKPRPAPRPRAVQASPPAPAPAADIGVWDRIAACESGNNWHINTGNKYSGGLQMDSAFWSTYGGLEYGPRPDLSSREAQITVAERARDGYAGHGPRGYHPWPTCARKLSLV